jgi:DNA-binding Lrp family transcriptional regulator
MDSIDRNIVRLLRLNARVPNSQLAAEVGLSPSACLRRVGNLEASGVIRGYPAPDRRGIPQELRQPLNVIAVLSLAFMAGDGAAPSPMWRKI